MIESGIGATALPQTKILVVDDSPEILAATTRLLESAGFKVLGAAGAVPGLAMVRGENPDIVLLAATLSDGDGRAVCAEIKNDPATMDCLVILTSNCKPGSGDLAEGLESGADGYIIRPLPDRELLARINAFARIKRAEEALNESELKFKAVFDASADAIGVSRAGILLYMNQAYVRLFGYADLAELVGRPILELHAPEAHPVLRDYTDRRLGGEAVPSRHESIGLRKDGSRFDAEMNISTYSYREEVFTCVIIRDITERKEANRVLQEARDFYLQVLKDAPALIWRAGIDAKCDWFNSAWLEFTGRTMEEESGEGWTEGVHRDDLDRCVRTYLDAFHARGRFEMEYRLRNAAGEYRWILDIGRPMTGTHGEFRGYIGYCFDITERREFQKRMESQLEELKRWQAVTLGRESRILELKGEVNALLEASKQKVRYETATTPAGNET